MIHAEEMFRRTEKKKQGKRRGNTAILKICSISGNAQLDYGLNLFFGGAGKGVVAAVNGIFTMLGKIREGTHACMRFLWGR